MVKSKLTRQSIEAIIDDLKKEHHKRYGEKMRKDYKGYEPKRKTYSMEHLFDDLRLVLYHMEVQVDNN